MDSLAVDWLDITGSMLAIGLLVGSFVLIAGVVWTRRKRQQ